MYTDSLEEVARQHNQVSNVKIKGDYVQDVHSHCGEIIGRLILKTEDNDELAEKYLKTDHEAHENVFTFNNSKSHLFTDRRGRNINQ